MKNDKRRVLINGASLSGLTAAARLAKNKYETFVIGQPYENTTIDGFEFDSAPLFSLPAVYRDFFQKTGRHFGQVLKVNAIDPSFVFRFPDLELNFASLSRSARLTEIELKLGKAAATEWDQLLKSAEYFWDRMRENYFEWEFSYRRADLPTYLKLRTPFMQNPYLQRILGHYATYFGYPAGIYKWSTLAAFVEESFGIWQVQGGLGALTGAVKDRALELGCKFQNISDFDYYIDATEIHSRPAQRLLGMRYEHDLPVRTVVFHDSGLTTDIYASRTSLEKYSLVLSGELTIKDFDSYALVDQLRPAIVGNADNKVLTQIRTSSRNRFRVRHMDSLAHAGICGELLANAVRGIQNRPSHEH